MKSGNQQVELIIIGANPSGLLLAAQLLNLGLHPIVIDSKSSSSKISPSISLQPRTLEIFNQLGLLDELFEQGLICKGLTVQMEKEVVGYLDYADLDLGTEFPYVLNIPQKKIEEVLIKYLTMKACPIYWDAKLKSLKQDDKSAEVQIERNNEITHRICKWIVVADGSQFNKIEQFSYNQWTINRLLYELDLQTEEQHNRKMHLFLSREGFVVGSPIDSSGRYDFIGTFPKKNMGSTKYSEIKAVLDQSLGFQIPVESCNWAIATSLKAELASEYLKQRCILIGNAAFSQSVFLGNEINNGIQSAHNLGWKLANVCSGKQDESILHSYEEERKGLDNFHFKRNYWLSKLLLVSKVLPLKIYNILINKSIKKFSWFVSNSNYRKSSLALHHSLGRKIMAGDHLPYLPVYDEKKKEETDLHTWCKKPGFVLLLLGNLSSHSLFIMAQWTRHRFTHHMHLFYLPYSTKNDLVFEAFDVQPGRNKMVLIRPDMHIGYIHDVIGANLIDTYMVEVMRWKF